VPIHSVIGLIGHNGPSAGTPPNGVSRSPPNTCVAAHHSAK